MSNGFALSTELLPLPVGSGPQLNNAAPSVRCHYSTLTPPTGRSAPVPRIGTLALAVFAAWASPFASERQVLTFHTRAWSGFAPPIGVARDSLQPCTLRKDETLWIEEVGSDGTEAFEGLVNFVPEVIAGERDMAPRQRGDLDERLVGNVDALSLGARQRSRPACDRPTGATNPQTAVVAHWADPTGFVAQKSSRLASYFSDSADDHGNQLFAVTQNAFTLNVRGCRESLATPYMPDAARAGFMATPELIPGESRTPGFDIV